MDTDLSDPPPVGAATAATAGDLALDVRGLTRSFGSLRAVDGLDLAVARGEAVGLLGPNGAGKTTSLRILTGLLAGDGGSARVLGLDPRTDGAELRGRIGVVPQELALYGGLTAAENLALFAELQGLVGARRRERVDWALEAAGLTERRGSRVETFSGGMKRRLNLVAALLHGPELVLLDEPTAGVDPQSRNHVFEQVERLHGAGTTLVYTTHQMGEVERLCDRVVVMDRGRVIADGTLDELRALPAVRRRSEGLLRLTDGTDPARAAAVLREAGIAAEPAGAVGETLEDVFLALTGRALRDGDGGAAAEATR